MDVEVKKPNSVTRKIQIKIQPGELREIESKIVKDLQKSAQIPGFRKGKVPAGIIKKKYADTIKMEVIEQAVSRYYGEALDKLKIYPVSQGKISNVSFETIDQGMELEIEVEVEPEIEVKKYKGLEVQREIPMVTESMVEEVLQNLRENYATKKALEEVREGSLVVFDAQAVGEGNLPIVGKKFENITVTIGSGEFDLEMEKELIGMKAGDKKIVEKISPNPDKSLEEETLKERYEITIKSIEEKELPELNDEFVKNLDDQNINTMEELRAVIRAQLEGDLKKRAREHFQERLIDELLKENPFDVPDSMVEHYLDHIVEDIRKQVKEGERVDEKLIRENYRAPAIHNIRWYMLKRKLAEMENIDVSVQELYEIIDAWDIDDSQKKYFKENVDKLDNLKNDLLEQKVLQMLESYAKVTEIYPPGVTPEEISGSESPVKPSKSEGSKTSSKEKSQKKTK